MAIAPPESHDTPLKQLLESVDSGILQLPEFQRGWTWDDDRIRNIILFSAKYFRRVLGVTLLQLFYWGLYLLFAPWSLLLLPLLGVWFIVFLSELLLYDRLDAELKINERFLELEGAPFEDETDTENPDTF